MNTLYAINYNTYINAYKYFKSKLSAYFSLRNYTIVSFFYLMAYVSLLLADVYYADDNIRRYSGKIATGGMGRVVDEVVVTLWNFSRSILDSSPLFQIYAILILATISISLLAIFNIKTGIFQLLSSTFIGIFPLYYANMVYKVDAPFMAMSILFGVLPFLYYNRMKLFYISSFLSALLILSTYQTALSSYLIVFLFVLSRDIVAEKKINAKRTIIGLLLFGAGVIFYRLTIYNLVNITHMDVSLIPLGSSAQGLSDNLEIHTGKLTTMLGTTNVLIVYIIAFLFTWQYTKEAKTNKFIAFGIAVTTIIIGFLLTGGLNILLAHYPVHTRYYLLFSFFVGILAICAADNANYVTKTAFIFFALYFFNLDNGIGNALKSKAEYNKLIIGHFIYDFKNLAGNNSYLIKEISGQNATFPAVYNINNNPLKLMSHHSQLVMSVMGAMDFGMQQHVETLLTLSKGKLPADQPAHYHVTLSRPDYDIYTNDCGTYKVIFKFCGSN